MRENEEKRKERRREERRDKERIRYERTSEDYEVKAEGNERRKKIMDEERNIKKN